MIGGTHSMHGERRNVLQNFGRKTCREMTIWDI